MREGGAGAGAGAGGEVPLSEAACLRVQRGGRGKEGAGAGTCFHVEDTGGGGSC